MPMNLRRGSIKAAGIVPSETESAIKPPLFPDRSSRFGGRGCLRPPVEVKSQILKPGRVFSSESTTAEGSAKCSGLGSFACSRPNRTMSKLSSADDRSRNDRVGRTVSMTSCQRSRPREQNQDCVALSPQTCMQIHFDPNIHFVTSW